MRQTSLVFLAMAIALPPSAGAQHRAPGVEVGDTVRINLANRGRHRGVVSRVADSGFVLRRAGRGDTLITQWSSGTRLQRLAGRRSRLANAGLGALTGLGVGAVGGAVIGAASYDPDGFSLGGSLAGEAGVGAVIFGTLLTPVGAVIGLLVPTERWQTISLDGVPRAAAVPFLRADPVRGHIAVGLSLSALTR
jgi:hypothetical protein